MIKTHSIPVGPLQANCHILHNQETNEAIVVDPGDDAADINQFLDTLACRVVAIWNTHGHLDHINGNAGVQAATKAPISIHQAAAPCLSSSLYSGADWIGIPLNPSKADTLWQGDETLTALGQEWKIRHTPGHSPGCCVIVCEAENLMVAGDLLFRNSIGRTDLPGGNPELMTQSLRGLFNDWGQDQWRVLTGHGPNTTIAEERRSNPFVRDALGQGL